MWSISRETCSGTACTARRSTMRWRRCAAASSCRWWTAISAMWPCRPSRRSSGCRRRTRYGWSMHFSAVVLLAWGAVQLQAGVCLRRGALYCRLAVLRHVPYPAAADCLEGFPRDRGRDDDEREHYPREDYLSEEVPRQGGGYQRYGRGLGRRDRSDPGRGHPLVRLLALALRDKHSHRHCHLRTTLPMSRAGISTSAMPCSMPPCSAC